MHVTFFPASIVGYVGYPAALLTRGLGSGLVARGHDVGSVEPRLNEAVTRTLRAVGAEAMRHFHAAFPAIHYRTFQARSGAPLLEWTSREVALIDVAVAVAGLDDELCRWLANISGVGLCRLYLTDEPERLTQVVADRLELAKFDRIIAPRPPAANLPWSRIPPALARADIDAGLSLPEVAGDIADPLVAAERFEAIVDEVRSSVHRDGLGVFG